LEVKVLGGVVYVESYAMKPSQDYVTVSVPIDRSSTAISMTPMNPENQVKGVGEAKCYQSLTLCQ